MRVLLTGATGLLGGYLLQGLVETGDEVVGWSGSKSEIARGISLQPVDISKADRVQEVFRQARPDIVIHTAALTKVDECHRAPERARQVNTLGTATLAELAADAGARLVYVSTDLVFDGAKGDYSEADEAKPLSIYGQTKLEAERAVLAFPRHLVVRVSWLFGPSLNSGRNFFVQLLENLPARRSTRLFQDEWRTPLSLATSARALIGLAHSDVPRLLHLGGPNRMTRLEVGLRLAAHLGLDASCILSASLDSVSGEELRPRDVSLNASRWRALCPEVEWPSFEEALREMGVE
jgi:dTDP-4-dehydrorhamnose reductase